MHPAVSVIFFTTASGAGYGLLALLCVFGATGQLPADQWFAMTAFGLAFGLVTAGLLSSTFHLGHPERAWRALSQWRSSWLSREAVAAVATYVPTGAFAGAWILLDRTDGGFVAVGLVGALFCAVTVYCTAMIYGSLRTIARWANPWVAPAYLSLALATGALLLALLTHIFGYPHRLIDPLAVVTIAVATIVKMAYWRAILTTTAASTPSSATGLGGPGLVRLLDAPHTETNYLLQEMGFRIARKHASRLRRISVLTLFVIPASAMLAVIFLGPDNLATVLTGAAVLTAAAGVLIERWLFFAEAKHTVTLYYGEATA